MVNCSKIMSILFKDGERKCFKCLWRVFWNLQTGLLNMPNGTLKNLVKYRHSWRHQEWSVKPSTSVVPNLFGTRDRCPYENLMPDDLRWSWDDGASAGERGKYRQSFARWPAAHPLLCGPVPNRPCTSSQPGGWGPLVYNTESHSSPLPTLNWL